MLRATTRSWLTGILLSLAFVGWGGCSSDEERAPGDALVAFEVSGGMAGFDDHLEVARDGWVDANGEDRVFKLHDGLLHRLRAALAQASFESLDSDYTAGDVVDEISYRISYGGRALQVDFTAAPEQLRPVLAQLNLVHAR